MALTAFVSTYAPHRCGIAVFTGDLAAASGPHQVVALHPVGGPSTYPVAVHHRIRRDEPADYRRVAALLNASDVEVVSIQHEFGIWGGEDGALVVDFVRALTIPAVTTLHTVLHTPTSSQRRVLTQLVEASALTVVMSDAAATLLRTVYGTDERKIRIIPHGVPDLPLVDPDTVKPRLGLAGRRVILSFGLLGPGKGYESVIEALPAVVATAPDALYVVLGATHPDLLRREGDAYRTRLTQLAATLGVSDHVRFVPRFVGRTELGTWLEAADLFVTPYPSMDQIVSGTLSYAMGAGRAVVSTPYAYARERLAGGRGRLVDPGSPLALAQALGGLLADREARERMGALAHAYTRHMVWPEIGARYASVFAAAAMSHAGRAVLASHPAMGGQVRARSTVAAQAQTARLAVLNG
jgi:glycosyltransferase involved in cell wall biosynthesis